MRYVSKWLARTRRDGAMLRRASLGYLLFEIWRHAYLNEQSLISAARFMSGGARCIASASARWSLSLNGLWETAIIATLQLTSNCNHKWKSAAISRYAKTSDAVCVIVESNALRELRGMKRKYYNGIEMICEIAAASVNTAASLLLLYYRNEASEIYCHDYFWPDGSESGDNCASMRCLS